MGNNGNLTRIKSIEPGHVELVGDLNARVQIPEVELHVGYVCSLRITVSTESRESTKAFEKQENLKAIYRRHKRSWIVLGQA